MWDILSYSLEAATAYSMESSPTEQLGTQAVFSQHSHMGRQLLQSTQVAGVGIGVFMIFFFLALSLLVCAVGSRTNSPGLIYFLSTTMWLIVLIVILGSPKGTQPVKPTIGYDDTIIPLVFIMVILVLGIVGSVLGMVFIHCGERHYARPLSYHMDVLREK